MSTLTARITRWRRAGSPEEIFGPLAPPQGEALRRRYRQLARATHPDRHPAEREAAHEAFALLRQWHDRALRQIAAGWYGQTPILVLESACGRYSLLGQPEACERYNRYAAESDGTPLLLKLARHPDENRWLQNEAATLQRIAAALEGEPLHAHFPRLHDSFLVRDAGGALRACNVFGVEAGTVRVTEVLASYPTGIPVPDMIWMWNRLLAALAATHAEGYVHGAPLPPHLLLRLADHNGILTEWGYSVPIGSPLPMRPTTHVAWEPPEVAARAPATPATDLYLAACTIARLLGGDGGPAGIPPTVPPPIRALLQSCLLPSPARRADDAWELFESLHSVARRLYGPPAFRPLAMPA